MNKNNNPSEIKWTTRIASMGRNTLIGLVVASIMLSCAAGWLSVARFDDDAGYELTFIQVLVFLAAGFAALKLFNGSQIPTRSWHPLDKLSVLAALTLIIICTLIVFYLTDGLHLLLIPVASGAAFLLPALTWISYSSFSEYKAETIAPWQIEETSDEKVTLSINRMPVIFRIKSTREGDEAHYYSATVPARLKLGKLFQLFLFEQRSLSANDAADLKANQWLFFHERINGLYSIQLHPGFTLGDNNIEPGSIITAIPVAGRSVQPVKTVLKTGKNIHPYKK